MASAFGGQRSIQLSYGCQAAPLAERTGIRYPQNAAYTQLDRLAASKWFSEYVAGGWGVLLPGPPRPLVSDSVARFSPNRVLFG